MEEKKITKETVEREKGLIIKINRKVIKSSGGELGIRDEGGIHNSAYKVLIMLENLEDPFRIAAIIYNEIATRHHFMDGNKRTAHIYAKLMLFHLRYYLNLNYEDAIKFIIQIANHDNPKSIEEIEKWLKENSIPVTHHDIEKYIKEVYDDIKYD